MDANTKYNREFVGFGGQEVTLDYYRIIAAFPELPEEVKHAMKKLLFLGVRGKANADQDLNEAILSLEKYKERIAQTPSSTSPKFEMIRDLEPQSECLKLL